MWGSFLRHPVCAFEGVPEFVESFVYRSPGFTNVHEEIFADRSDAVEPGLFGDFPEFVFVCGEGDPRGPKEGAPVIEEVGDIFGVEVRLICGIGTHSLLRIG